MSAPRDLGNDLLGPQPAQITGSIVDTELGERCMLTIRTPSTTLTVFLAKPEAIEWGRNVSEVGNAMSGLIAANGVSKADARKLRR